MRKYAPKYWEKGHIDLRVQNWGKESRTIKKHFLCVFPKPRKHITSYTSQVNSTLSFKLNIQWIVCSSVLSEYILKTSSHKRVLCNVYCLGPHNRLFLTND